MRILVLRSRRRTCRSALRANLACILRTVRRSESCPGHSTAPAFTSASSDIAFLPSTDTLPPFPMCRALPGSEYYGGSAPHPRLRQASRLSPPHPWRGRQRGTHAGGSHVHCCPVNGLGTRLC